MSGPISFVKFIVSLSQLPAFQYTSTAWLLILSTVFQFRERYLPTCDGSKKGNSFPVTIHRTYCFKMMTVNGAIIKFVLDTTFHERRLTAMNW